MVVNQKFKKSFAFIDIKLFYFINTTAGAYSALFVYAKCTFACQKMHACTIAQ